MDFSNLSATRIASRIYPLQLSGAPNPVADMNPKFKPNTDAIKYILTTHVEPGELTDNFVDARICYRDLSTVTREDLELLGCTDKEYQNSLLERFKMMSRQERNYLQILQSEEAQTFNETILKKTASHLYAMHLGLVSAYYKLNMIPPKDIVVTEKNFASRFVLDALAELQNVTDEIESQLDALAKEAQPLSKKSSSNGGLKLNFRILITTALGIGFSIWVWREPIAHIFMKAVKDLKNIALNLNPANL